MHELVRVGRRKQRICIHCNVRLVLSAIQINGLKYLGRPDANESNPDPITKNVWISWNCLYFHLFWGQLNHFNCLYIYICILMKIVISLFAVHAYNVESLLEHRRSRDSAKEEATEMLKFLDSEIKGKQEVLLRGWQHWTCRYSYQFHRL